MSQPRLLRFFAAVLLLFTTIVISIPGKAQSPERFDVVLKTKDYALLLYTGAISAHVYAYGKPFSANYSIPQMTEFFFRSPIVAGAATHKVDWNGGSLTKAAGTQVFSYAALVDPASAGMFGGAPTPTPAPTASPSPSPTPTATPLPDTVFLRMSKDPNVSAETRKTIDAVLSATGKTNCAESEDIVRSRRELDMTIFSSSSLGTDEKLIRVKTRKSLGLTDLSPISDWYFLERLDVSNNSIVDISALERLTNLVILNVSGNSIRDISVLRKLRNLKFLNIERNRIMDFSALSAMNNLAECAIAHNPGYPDRLKGLTIPDVCD